jgi:hypothetical protein
MGSMVRRGFGWGTAAAWLAVLALAAGCGSSGDDTQTDNGGDADTTDTPTDDTTDRPDTDGRDVPDGEAGPECGNGTVDGTEQCDDGNTVDGDGCDADCTWTCDPTDDTCPVEQHCDAATHMCVAGCRADAACTDPLAYCDTDAHECVECLTNECDPGFVCVDFACVAGCDETSPCGTGFECCGGGCVDTTTSLTHCGACDTLCDVTNGTPACVAGACTVESCDTNFADCNDDVTDGCETTTDTDLANCGTCANACPTRANATIACTAGSCEFACTDPFADCNGLADDGCEADTDTDSANCGTCTNGCLVPSGTPGCVAGLCTVGGCDTGFGDCNGDVTDGCETNTATDLLNCGTCANACGTPANGTATCATGVCAIDTCAAGYTDCDGDFGNGCEIQTAADPANCGTCANVCSVTHATAGCASGLCTVGTCDTGWADCNTTVSDGCEVDTTTDVANCGTCTNLCATPAHGTAGCAASVCGVSSCDTGWGNCNGLAADGCETDTTTAVANCGTCGTVCPAPLHAAASCAGGTCGMGACTAPWGDCNADPADGCEIQLNTIIDCGACGRACSSTYGTPSCTGSPAACAIACYTNYGNCDSNVDNGCEADLRTDNNNCGACGNVCISGRVCVGSTCIVAPPANDTRAGAIAIAMTNPATTLTTNTTSAVNNTAGTCGCTSGNDVFYSFTLTAPELVYADTIGTAFDTSLFLQDSAGVNLTAAGVTGGTVCSDNGGVGCTSGNQSMILAYLNAGTYYLVLSGCASGAATIHFQHLPVGNGTLSQIATLAGTLTLTGTTSGTGRVAATCGNNGAGPENTHWLVTCPTFASTVFSASTVGGAAWDTVLEERSAARAPVSVCNDDQCNGVQSTVTGTIPAGAGLHAFYVHGYSTTSMGAYTMTVVAGGCPATQTQCGAACRALLTDPVNCGCCGTVCPTPANATPGCAAGACGIGACNVGWGNCDGSAANGCETNTTNNNANCGGCGIVCGTGTSCVASACRPTNDLCTAATPINLTLGSRIAVSGRTTNAYHNITAPAGCATAPTAPDVYYSFTLTRRELVYVDSFGSTYDTVLFFANGCATPIGATTTGDRVCDNDRGGICTTGGTASQIVALLAPGTYYLVVSGNGTASGAFTLNLEHLAVGNDTVTPLAAGTTLQAGATAGTGVLSHSCGWGTLSPEDNFWWRTCPESASGSFTANTCSGATWDTVLALYNGSGVGNLCNDDVGGTCGFRSTITGTVAAGAGLHLLILDGFGDTSLGTYSMAVTRP